MDSQRKQRQHQVLPRRCSSVARSLALAALLLAAQLSIAAADMTTVYCNVTGAPACCIRGRIDSCCVRFELTALMHVFARCCPRPHHRPTFLPPQAPAASA
jgi:hypothetical protein